MNITTFNDDLLELKDFATRLEKFIDVERHFVQGGLVLALSSKYGTGKTTFLNMWRSEMIASNTKRIVVSLNAWDSDYIGDPLFAIISSLTDTFSDAGENVNEVIEAAKDLGWFFTGMGAQVTERFTGINPVEAGKLAEAKKKLRKGVVPLPNAFSEFEKRKGGMGALKVAIRDLIGKSSHGVLFLVDELDRCRPDYAITYLETIKHIFDFQEAVFILAADRNQLENSAKTAFGRDLDFDEYYRKFIHREVTLPAISSQSYNKLSRKYVEFYLNPNQKRFSLLNIDNSLIENISTLISKLQLTPRQIQEVFRILGHLCATSENQTNKLHWCIGVGSYAMAVFKVGAPTIYSKIGRSILTVHDAITFFQKLDGQSITWWIALLFTGDGLNIPAETKFESLIEEYDLSTERVSGNLADFYSGWGYGAKGRFQQIYNKVQHIDQWKE